MIEEIGNWSVLQIFLAWREESDDGNAQEGRIWVRERTFFRLCFRQISHATFQLLLRFK